MIHMPPNLGRVSSVARSGPSALCPETLLSVLCIDRHSPTLRHKRHKEPILGQLPPCRAGRIGLGPTTNTRHGRPAAPGLQVSAIRADEI